MTSTQALTPHPDHRLRRDVVERRHHRHGLVEERRVDRLLLAGGGDDAAAYRLCEDERVAGTRPGVGDLGAGPDDPGHGEAVLRLGVVHGVAADDEDAGLPGLGGAALEYLDKDVLRERGGESDYVEGEQRRSPHRVDVAEGVRRGHLSEDVGIVDDRREEIHRLNEGYVVVQAVDGGVVGRADPDQEVGVGGRRQLAQHLRQVRWTKLGSSAGAAGQAGQSDFFHSFSLLGSWICEEYSRPVSGPRLP